MSDADEHVMLQRLKAGLFSCILLLAACSGSSSSPSAIGLVPPVSTHRALVVGAASGDVYRAIAARYAVEAGSGNEDPSAYDVVVFDGNSTTPQALSTNAAVRSFLNAGKAVILLNNTAAHREAAFKGLLFAHVKGDSPGSIFYITHDASGQPHEVEIEFPVHLLEGLDGKPATPMATTDSQITQDAGAWMDDFKKRFASGEGSNISPASAGAGQTVASFDLVQPANLAMPSKVNTLTPPNGLEFCGNRTEPGGQGTCNQQNPNITDPAPSADFETTLNVLLEPNGNQFSYKLIERQFAFLSTWAWPGASWDYGWLMADSLNGTNAANFPMKNFLGFNEFVGLSAGPAWGGMTVVEAQPTATNGTSSLTTSQSQTEQVGLSATGGYQAGGVGLVSANWSDAWTWGSASTINITDWANSATQVGNAMEYDFWANGNTPDTYNAVQSGVISGSPGGNGYNAPQERGLKIGGNFLNPLQASGITSQDETAWVSPSWSVGQTPVITGEQTFFASATFDSGEVYEMYQNILSDVYNYGNLGSVTLSEPIAIDFDTPSLVPPNPAPWSLTFGQYTSTGNGYNDVTGTVTLDSPAAVDTTIDLTYVVQPHQSISVQPAYESCPGVVAAFAPGPNVINGGSPPTSVTIKAGQRSASFNLSMQAYNSTTYNVQIISWLPATNISGTMILNAESAQCLTPPNT